MGNDDSNRNDPRDDGRHLELRLQPCHEEKPRASILDSEPVFRLETEGRDARPLADACAIYRHREPIFFIPRLHHA